MPKRGNAVSRNTVSPSKWNVLIQWFGRILMLASVWFVARTLLGLNIQDLQFAVEPFGVAAIVISFLALHAVNMIVQTYGWKLILDFVGQKSVAMIDAIPIFMKSNIAKYLPGNVFEFVSRNVLGAKYGWKHSHLALSSVLEIGLAVMIFFLTSAILMAAGVLPSLPLLTGYASSGRTLYAGAIVLCGGFGGFWLLRRVEALAVYRKRILSRAFVGFFARFFSVQMALFVINATLFIMVFLAFLPEAPELRQLAYLAGAYLIANFAGYIVPGSPGGIGVREAALVYLLGPSFGEHPVVVAALGHRVLSIVGDVIAYAMGVAVERMSDRRRVR